MSYEIEDWYDLGDFARSRYLQPDEENDMPDLNVKKFDADGKQRNGGVPCVRGNGGSISSEIPRPIQRFEEWKRNFPEPKFMTGDELPVETEKYQFLDLPAIKPRLVAGTNWESVDACRRESVERLDRQQRGRIFAGVFWGVMVIAGALALLAGAVQGVQALYKAVLP